MMCLCVDLCAHVSSVHKRALVHKRQCLSRIQRITQAVVTHRKLRDDACPLCDPVIIQTLFKVEVISSQVVCFGISDQALGCCICIAIWG